VQVRNDFGAAAGRHQPEGRGGELLCAQREIRSHPQSICFYRQAGVAARL